MVPVIVAVFVIIWILGYSPLEVKAISEMTAFFINGKQITFLNIAFIITTVYFIYLIPKPFKQVGVVILGAWIAALLGVINAPWADMGIGIIIIIGLIFYALNGV